MTYIKVLGNKDLAEMGGEKWENTVPSTRYPVPRKSLAASKKGAKVIRTLFDV
jgi:hypothetical protein